MKVKGQGRIDDFEEVRAFQPRKRNGTDPVSSMRQQAVLRFQNGIDRLKFM